MQNTKETMPSILSKIIADKQKEVQLKKNSIPITQLEAAVFFKRQGISLKKALQNSTTGIIAEHKRRSPSKATINQHTSVWEVAKGYENAGACGMSVLTDGKYFGGSLDDMVLARAAVNLPLLRKEFIIDAYQIIEAKAYGADAILLIAAALSKEMIQQLFTTAKNLGLEVLLEVHNEAELQRSLLPGIAMIGVNNRDLNTFKVDLAISKMLSEHIPDTVVKVSESGISNPQAIRELQAHGYRGFLVGEYFMQDENPGEKANTFIKKLKVL